MDSAITQFYKSLSEDNYLIFNDLIQYSFVQTKISDSSIATLLSISHPSITRRIMLLEQTGNTLRKGDVCILLKLFLFIINILFCTKINGS